MLIDLIKSENLNKIVNDLENIVKILEEYSFNDVLQSLPEENDIVDFIDSAEVYIK